MKAIPNALLVLALALLAPRPVAAAVNVERSGSENPMVEVARSTLYGGLTGLMLGGALALVDDSHHDSDYLKWGFVTGTFFGFGYGLYHVHRRPSPEALLEIESGAPAWRVPEVTLGPDGTMRASLVAMRF